MSWKAELEYQQSRLRTILLHKHPLGMWRCRLADVGWSYGGTRDEAMRQAVRAWILVGRPSWNTEHLGSGCGPSRD